VAEVPTDLLIDGDWRSARSGARFVVTDPATGEPIAEVADGRADDAAAALAAAATAGPSWAGTPARDRTDVLRRAAAALRERAEPLAALATLEMGKPLPESRAEISYAAEFLDWYAGEALRTPGGLSRSPAGTTTIAITREPVGVCVLVTPWNFPVAMPARKLAPALAAGCTVVLSRRILRRCRPARCCRSCWRPACRPASSTSCTLATPEPWWRRCCAIDGHGSCPSRARPRSAGG
jgi:succinate-semialdehyde dehydrogenase/glutarate-semialdehyde dehydrogenase